MASTTENTVKWYYIDEEDGSINLPPLNTDLMIACYDSVIQEDITLDVRFFNKQQIIDILNNDKLNVYAWSYKIKPPLRLNTGDLLRQNNLLYDLY